MRVGLRPGNPFAWLLDKFGLMPRALLETLHGTAHARCIMLGVKLGVFEALDKSPQSLDEIAAATSTHPPSLERLLGALTGGGYLAFRDGKWSLRSHARRWLVRSSPRCIADQMLHGFVQWKAIEGFENFVRTGQPLDLHQHFTPGDWTNYQRGMKQIASLAIGEVVARSPMPKDPRRMLDIGGSHGLYSVAFCRKYRTLEAVVLDLPEAVEHAAPLLAEENMGPRVVHQAGDSLTESLGDKEWDFIFVSQLLHHFTAQANQDLCQRVARALKLGGIFAVSEIERAPTPHSQIRTIFDLYFAATSRSGTWSADQIRSWQSAAGLKLHPPIRLWTMPGVAILPAEATT
jgi:SAM-dependent methyltransferase